MDQRSLFGDSIGGDGSGAVVRDPADCRFGAIIYEI
jgi:hypothetical protein